MYSKKRMSVSVVASVISVSVLIVFVLSSQIAVGILPVLGVGGFYAEADYFYGQDGGRVYPQMDDSATPHGATDTSECEERPMLVFELEDARVYGFKAFVDIELPFVDRWMTVKVEQPSGADYTDSAYIDGDSIKIYATQFGADYLSVRNVVLTEDGGYQEFGPNSDEFLIKADPTGQSGFREAIYSENAKVWMHAVTGQNIVFDRNQQLQSLTFEVTYPTTSELESRYSNSIVSYTGSEAAPNSPDSREAYFDCLPP